MTRPLLLPALLALALLAAAPPAAASGDLFENRSDAKAFKAKCKRDPFALRAAAAPPVAPVAIEKTEEVAVVPEIAPPVESFRVTGIIRVGGRGCAIVNEKTWFLGKTNLGYELVGLTDDRIEIKTPDGRTVSCELIRERSASEGFDAPAAP